MFNAGWSRKEDFVPCPQPTRDLAVIDRPCSPNEGDRPDDQAEEIDQVKPKPNAHACPARFVAGFPGEGSDFLNGFERAERTHIRSTRGLTSITMPELCPGFQHIE